MKEHGKMQIRGRRLYGSRDGEILGRRDMSNELYGKTK